MFRTDRRADPSLNFIDGDLIECFLDLKLTAQTEVAAALRVPVHEVLRRVEELSRMH
jgi:DNA damage-binding protein 1